MPGIRNFVRFTVAAAVFVTASSCYRSEKSVETVLTTTVDGRKIKVTVDGPAFMQPDTEGATIRFEKHEVRVEKVRLLVDGEERAAIPAEAKDVDVVVSGSTLTVTVDGQEAPTATIEIER
ncbi:MAG: hypothetical protein WD468_13205 [Pirellulales bacterium]